MHDETSDYNSSQEKRSIQADKTKLIELRQELEEYRKESEELNEKLYKIDMVIRKIDASISSIEGNIEIEEKRKKAEEEKKETKEKEFGLLNQSNRALKVENMKKEIQLYERSILAWKVERSNVEEKKEIQILEKRILEKRKTQNDSNIERVMASIMEMECSIKDKEEKKLEKKGTEKLERPWRRILKEPDGTCDQRVKDHFRQKLVEIRDKLTGATSINILLVGSSGSGKSSFMRTCAAAAKNEERMVYVSTIRGHGHICTTRKLISEKLKDSEGKYFKVRIFDSLGLTNSSSCGKEVVDLISKGHIRPSSKIEDALEMRNNKEVFVENPSLDDEMHCIVYVVDPRENETDLLNDKTGKEIFEMLRIESAANKPQLVLLNFMDHIVPNNDLVNIFKYPCVERKCKLVSEKLQMSDGDILPMANYTNETLPTDEKDALALFNIWRMASYGNDYIEQKIQERKNQSE